MTDRPLPRWKPGTSGRGLLVRGAGTDDIRLETWPTDVAGAPYHAEGARRLGVDLDSAIGFLIIDPQGRFSIPGSGAKRSDLVAEAMRQCRELRFDPGPDQLEWRLR